MDQVDLQGLRVPPPPQPAPPPPPASPPPGNTNLPSGTSDDPFLRQKKVLLLQRYEQYFPEVVKPILQGKNLNDPKVYTVSTLDSLMQEVQFAVRTRNGGYVNDWIAQMTLEGAEEFCMNFTPILARGPAGRLSTLTKNPEYMSVVREIQLEHLDLVALPPHYRLLMMTLNGLYVIHGANRDAMMRQLNTVPSAPAQQQNVAELEALMNELQADAATRTPT